MTNLRKWSEGNIFDVSNKTKNEWQKAKSSAPLEKLT